GAVFRQQQLAERGATAAAHPFAAGHRWRSIARGSRGRLMRIGWSKFVALEVEIEALVEQALLVGRFRHDERERVFQHGAVGEAYQVDSARGVDALGGGDTQACAAGYLEEAAQGFAG